MCAAPGLPVSSPGDGAESSSTGETDREELKPGGASGTSFPVVGIGASAGGLRAFQAFFSALPAQPDMAFVLVQHLSPDHESTLAELIQSRTQMEVTQVAAHPTVEPNRVYVIPPGKHLEIENGRLKLVDLHRDQGRPAAVDHFFRSLAEDMQERAVCIVLSGTGSDGSLGLKAIKEWTGLTMAQTPEDAEYDGMPRSAIDTGLVDIQGTAAELARTLVRFRQAADRIEMPGADADEKPDSDQEALQAIFAHLKQRTAHDFAQYKQATILRRLARRLQVTGAPTLAEYASRLGSDADEVQALLRDFLISVTQFFRDPDAFDALERQVIPRLFEGKGPRDQVRVWVAGCATGEEAYSVAMLLCEHRSTLAVKPEIQVFATDIDEEALHRAREGAYTRMAAADLPPHLIQRYFEVRGDGVHVKQELRQMVLFADHNLISDPPFSRLDLVACRNVLIYLGRELQQRLFGLFQYALNPGGFLFLGAAEGTDALSKGFSTLSKKHRLYQRKEGTGTSRLPAFNVGSTQREPARVRPYPSEPPSEGLVERYNGWTLEQYAPPRLLVDEHYDITHVFGNAGKYLRDREGPVTQNVVDKVLRVFRIDLRAALFEAFSEGTVTETRFHRVELEGGECIVRMRIGPVGGLTADDGLAEVVFIELDMASVDALGAVYDGGDGERAEDPTISKQEDEIRRLRARLQLTLEESESSTEEMKASNEELQSINEELQSTTEELETSKEELQSTNEELTTVNQELKNKVAELVRTNSDLQNLIASTDIGTLFLDRSLRIKRFTPRAADVFHIIPSDIGRPFEHISHRLLDKGLAADAQNVLESLVGEEKEVRSEGDLWYTIRILPYRAMDDSIEGVVLTLVDITDQKSARDEAARRAGQQKIVADLGTLALEGGELSGLFRVACETVADCLGGSFAKVLRHRPDQGDLVVEQAVGWPEALIGTATVPDGIHSQAGYTLVASSPVVVPDLAEETRFEGPPLLTDFGVRSGISVPIGKGPDGPFGVLGVHDVEPRSFSEDDAAFVQAIANVLGDAIRSHSDARTIHEQLVEIETVYATAPVGLAFLDTTLHYRRINQRLADINGLSVEEHVGKRGQDLFPELARVVDPYMQRVLDTGTALEDVELQGTTLRDPNDLRDWLGSYVPVFDAEGNAIGVSVAVRDITNRKRVEVHLQETLQRLELAMDAPGLGAYDVDLVAGTTTYDKRAQELFMEPEVLAFEDALGRAHPDDADALDAALATARDPAGDDPAFRSVHRHIRPDGSVLWVAARGRVQFEGEGEDRRAVRMIGVAMDVTDIRTVQEQLRRQLAEVESYFNAVPVGIAVLDREGRYVKVNRQIEDLTGRTADELVGMRARDVWPVQAAEDKRYVQRVMRTGLPILNAEIRLPLPTDPDGNLHDWLVSIYPLRSGDTVYGVSVVIQDVTVIRKAQLALEHQAAELEARVAERTEQVRQLATEVTQAEQAERQRIAEILHDDLQQLLYAMQIKTQLLRRVAGEGGNAEERYELVAETDELIDRAIHATRSLTADLSPPLLHDEGFERALEWGAHRMSAAHNLSVTIEGEKNVQVQLDVQVLLFQIVREMLFNIVKHAQVDQATVHVASDGERIRITISDEGVGFNPDVLAPNESGMGLLRSRERLKLIGGSLHIDSNPGRGMRVTIESPVYV